MQGTSKVKYLKYTSVTALVANVFLFAGTNLQLNLRKKDEGTLHNAKPHQPEYSQRKDPNRAVIGVP